MSKATFCFFQFISPFLCFIFKPKTNFLNCIIAYNTRVYIRVLHIFLKKMCQPWPLFHLFLSFQTHIKIFTTNKCEKMSILDSNSRPLEHESPPITTKPGLPPRVLHIFYNSVVDTVNKLSLKLL